MHQYGPTFLTTKIALKEDLGKLIRCTTKLPDVSEVVEGAVMQLTLPQQGYVATHFYKCADGRWMDVTSSCGPVERKVAGTLNLKYELILSSVEGYETTWATGYLDLWWKPAGDNEIAGELVYETVVRKPCVFDEEGNPVFPVDPTDGEVIVRVPKGTEYTEAKPYRFDDTAYGTDMQNRYCYRLFHVYASGWWSYTDGPYLAIAEKV